MLGFYKWIDIDPDLRLNEWLGFAIIMPLVFGVSFQTPLVMLFFNRIGIFTWQAYLSKWRYAMFGLAVFAAVITPSTDVVSMLCLFIPTYVLYLIGVLLCYLMPTPGGLLGPVEEEAEVGV
jgi:sec-independent protein translocase protein TatC